MTSLYPADQTPIPTQTTAAPAEKATSPTAKIPKVALAGYGHMLRPRCEDADGKTVDGNWQAVCWAFVSKIDGEDATSVVHHETQIPVGRHELTITCGYVIARPGESMLPTTGQRITYPYTFEASTTKYYIWAEVVDHQCDVWISKEAPPPPASIWKAIIPFVH